MAADLHIHSMAGIAEEDLARFFVHNMGSKYFDLGAQRQEGDFEKIMGTDDVWIGEVSWLKAGLTDSPETFVPGPVQTIFELIPEEPRPVLTEELAGQIVTALRGENTTQYRIATEDAVQPWLAAHMGHTLFTVSW